MDFLSVQEVAEYLKVSPHTIRRHIKEGNLQAYALGDGWRILKEDMLKFIENSKVNGGNKNE